MIAICEEETSTSDKSRKDEISENWNRDWDKKKLKISTRKKRGNFNDELQQRSLWRVNQFKHTFQRFRMCLLICSYRTVPTEKLRQKTARSKPLSCCLPKQTILFFFRSFLLHFFNYGMFYTFEIRYGNFPLEDDNRSISIRHTEVECVFNHGPLLQKFMRIRAQFQFNAGKIVEIFINCSDIFIFLMLHKIFFSLLLAVD